MLSKAVYRRVADSVTYADCRARWRRTAEAHSPDVAIFSLEWALPA